MTNFVQTAHMARKVFFIVVAGGSGTRMGSEIPKQFLTLDGRAILHMSIQALLEAAPEAGVVTVLPAGHIPYWKDYCLEHNFLAPQVLVPGGLTRYHSVKAALAKVPEGAIAAIHDGVRPLVPPSLVREMLDAVETLSARALVPCLPATDTLKVLQKGEGPFLEPKAGAGQPLRQEMFAVQTPQVFLSEDIKAAYEGAYDTSFTDDSSVAMAAGIPVSFCRGEKNNLKITTPEDLSLAAALININRGR